MSNKQKLALSSWASAALDTMRVRYPADSLFKKNKLQYICSKKPNSGVTQILQLKS